jgi:AcrR family transcriptional regulator
MPRLARKPLNTYHHGDLRDALVRAALQEAELGGPEAINISALAKKLGVSQPAPYRHFADREALLSAVTAEAFRQFNATLPRSARNYRASCRRRWRSVFAATASTD